MKWLIIIIIMLLCSCNCSIHNPKKRPTNHAIFMVGKGYFIHLCNEQDHEVRFIIPTKKHSYEIGTDSMGYGYTATVNYWGKNAPAPVRVGAGSEFEVGKCRFRVIKVFSIDIEMLFNPIDSNQSILQSNRIAIQQLRAPARCFCANKELKVYRERELEPDWLSKIYADYWRRNK